MTLSPPPAGRHGFSLTEMLIVIVMVGLMSAIALPKMIGARQRMSLDAVAQQVAGDLRRAQAEAIKRNTSVRLTRSGTTGYTIEFIGARALEGGVTFNASSAAEVRLAPVGPPVSGGGSFLLELAGFQKSVIVSPAGLVRVQ